MKKIFSILSLGLFALVVVQIVSDIALAKYHLGNGTLWLPNILIYFVTAYAGARRRGFKVGVLFAALLGAFDATIGWINDNYVLPGSATVHLAFTAWIITILAITLLATLVGLAAAALAAALKRRGEKNNY